MHGRWARLLSRDRTQTRQGGCGGQRQRLMLGRRERGRGDGRRGIRGGGDARGVQGRSGSAAGHVPRRPRPGPGQPGRMAAGAGAGAEAGAGAGPEPMRVDGDADGRRWRRRAAKLPRLGCSSLRLARPGQAQGKGRAGRNAGNLVPAIHQPWAGGPQRRGRDAAGIRGQSRRQARRRRRASGRACLWPGGPTAALLGQAAVARRRGTPPWHRGGANGAYRLKGSSCRRKRPAAAAEAPGPAARSCPGQQRMAQSAFARAAVPAARRRIGPSARPRHGSTAATRGRHLRQGPRALCADSRDFCPAGHDSPGHAVAHSGRRRGGGSIPVLFALSFHSRCQAHWSLPRCYAALVRVEKGATSTKTSTSTLRDKGPSTVT